MSKTVFVELQERTYPIEIGSGAFGCQVKSLLDRLGSVRHAFILWDEHLESPKNTLEGLLAEQGVRVSHDCVPSGEGSKCVEQLSRIWNRMLEERADRKTVVFAIGGGVVGDLAGFVSGSYMRGVRFVQIPSTLLAMVDSSVGGKTGINLPGAKNIVGAFWQPHGVVIDTAILDSLPQREFISGLAEIVKYGIILDAELFEFMELNSDRILNREPDALTYLIQRSCELKAQVVASDERETLGLRAILNYGHTFGHAIEAVTEYGAYLHGEAISIGMSMAASLAVQLDLWKDEEYIRQTKLLQTLHLPTKAQGTLPLDAILQAMQADKKNEHGVLNLILPTKIGHVEIVKGISESHVIEAIQAHAQTA